MMNLEWLRCLLHFPMDEHYRYCRAVAGDTPQPYYSACVLICTILKHDSREANEYSKVVFLLK